MLLLETISVEDKCYLCQSGEEDPSEYTIITQRFMLRKDEEDDFLDILPQTSTFTRVPFL
jgi:hypothetical protein